MSKDNQLFTSITKNLNKLYKISINDIDIQIDRYEAMENENIIWYDGLIKIKFDILEVLDEYNESDDNNNRLITDIINYFEKYHNIDLSIFVFDSFEFTINRIELDMNSPYRRWQRPYPLDINKYDNVINQLNNLVFNKKQENISFMLLYLRD
jgi:hypothetical protein